MKKEARVVFEVELVGRVGDIPVLVLKAVVVLCTFSRSAQLQLFVQEVEVDDTTAHSTRDCTPTVICA